MLMERDTITTIDCLPDDLLFDILVRLAADYLYDRARLVCRRWRHIIQYSDAFTSTHFQQHSTYGLLLTLPLTSPPHSIYATATQDCKIETSNWSQICTNETSANGLVLVSNIESVHVINPATKQSFLLPSVTVPYISVYRSSCGIAYSAATMEYKVTLPYRTTGEGGQLQYCLDIVTVGVDKFWRCVDIPPECDRKILSYGDPISSEGFLHWGRDRYCLTMNVETEMITRSEVPIPLEHYYSYYYVSTGRYLTFLACREELLWEVWEMRPAEGGEWRKVLPDIHLEPQKSKLPTIASDHKLRLFCPGWVKYPEVLAFCFWGDLEKMCIFYNLVRHEIDIIDLPHSPTSAIVHRNSLVWLS